MLLAKGWQIGHLLEGSWAWIGCWASPSHLCEPQVCCLGALLCRAGKRVRAVEEEGHKGLPPRILFMQENPHHKFKPSVLLRAWPRNFKTVWQARKGYLILFPGALNVQLVCVKSALHLLSFLISINSLFQVFIKGVPKKVIGNLTTEKRTLLDIFIY